MTAGNSTAADPALAWHAAGCSVVPVAADGTKRPAIGWKEFQEHRADPDTIAYWFDTGPAGPAGPDGWGIGVVCGAVSGNLEMFELEGRAIGEDCVQRLGAAMLEHDQADLWRTVTNGYVEASPSGGVHLYYRLVDGPARRNTKLASRPSTDDELAEWKAVESAKTEDPERLAKIAAMTHAQVPQVLIETRGEGGYTVVAPTGGHCHPTGRGWTVLAGSLDHIPLITAEQRDTLHAIANLLDAMPVNNGGGDITDRPEYHSAAGYAPGSRPGDDYNAKASWEDLLVADGWTRMWRIGPGWGWRRPGKTDRSISATTGTRRDADCLYVFSTSVDLPTEKPISKFAYVALTRHGGDWVAAARALRRDGYGSPPTITATRPPVVVGTARHLTVVPDPDTPTDGTAALMSGQSGPFGRLATQPSGGLPGVSGVPALVGPSNLPPLISLDVLLAEPEEPVIYRIERLLPIGGRVVLAAQFKAGKTTLRDNLVRSLADADPFLREFAVTPLPEGRTVVVIDNEMNRGQIRRWLADQGIQHPERVQVAILRGQVGTFDLLDEGVRASWVAALRAAGAAVVIFDCLRPVLDALGLDESHDAGKFLVAFDAMLRGADVSEAFIVHHMGHSGERSRGDSRIRDWPDVEWRLVRLAEDGKEADPAAARYFSAYGRDVDVPEGALTFDPDTRHLILAGGSRKEARKEQQDAKLRPFIIRAVAEAPGINATALVLALRRMEGAPPFRDREVSGIADGLAADGKIRIEGGEPGRPKRHFLADPVQPRPTPSTDALDLLPLTPSTPSTGDGVGVGANGTDQQHREAGRGTTSQCCAVCGKTGRQLDAAGICGIVDHDHDMGRNALGRYTQENGTR